MQGKGKLRKGHEKPLFRVDSGGRKRKGVGIRARIGRRRGGFRDDSDIEQGGNLRAFAPDAFDYIVVDEFHHGMAESYRKALAFCNTVAHARYTAEHLKRDHGISAVALTGESGDDYRAKVIGRLRDENDPLEVICTVDIFNEGVDIPEVTHVLFLRPTQSFTVFLQRAC